MCDRSLSAEIQERYPLIGKGMMCCQLWKPHLFVRSYSGDQNVGRFRVAFG